MLVRQSFKMLIIPPSNRSTRGLMQTVKLKIESVLDECGAKECNLRVQPGGTELLRCARSVFFCLVLLSG